MYAASVNKPALGENTPVAGAPYVIDIDQLVTIPTSPAYQSEAPSLQTPLGIDVRAFQVVVFCSLPAGP